MAVPKAAANFDDRAVAREHNVWFAGKPLIVKSKPQTRCVECATKREFRPRVLTSDRGHVLGPGQGIYDISHFRPGDKARSW
jgi:hypothetical protein